MQFLGSAETGLGDIAPDGAGGAFLVGGTQGSFGGPSAGSSDVWLSRYDRDGNELWIEQFGTAGADAGGVMAPDGRGGVLLTGITEGDLTRPSLGATDAWVSRYNADGERAWIEQFGSAESDAASAIAVVGAGVVIAGSTRGSIAAPADLYGDAMIARYADDACPADCDGDGELTFFDFLCFQNLFAAGDPGADCDGDSTLTFFDFLCFQNAFAAGCP